MAIAIPSLVNTPIVRLYSAVYIDNPGEELLSWVRSVGPRHQANVHGNLWLHDNPFTFKPSSGGTEIAGLVLALDYEQSDERNESVQELVLLQERASHFLGRPADINLAVTYHTPVKDIPKNGKIDALLGVTSEADKIRSEFIGAKQRVHGSVFEEFEWELYRGAQVREPTIRSVVEAWYWKSANAADDVLTRHIPLALKAYDFFVLDKPADNAIIAQKQAEQQ